MHIILPVNSSSVYLLLFPVCQNHLDAEKQWSADPKKEIADPAHATGCEDGKKTVMPKQKSHAFIRDKPLFVFLPSP